MSSKLFECHKVKGTESREMHGKLCTLTVASSFRLLSMQSNVAYFDTMAVAANSKSEINYASTSNAYAPDALYHTCYANLPFTLCSVPLQMRETESPIPGRQYLEGY
jgi:hypothetical protein